MSTRTSRRPPRSAPPDPGGEKLTIAELCTELKISRSTFYHWRQTGKAPRCIVLPNREVRVTRAVLDGWLDAHTETAR